MHHQLELGKATLGLILTTAAYITNHITSYIAQIAGNVPDWLKWAADYGMAGVCIALLCYTLVTLYKAHREAVAGRLKDRDEFLKICREDAEKSRALHEKSMEALVSHKAAMDNYAEKETATAVALTHLAAKIDTIR